MTVSLVGLRIRDPQNRRDIGVPIEVHSVASTFTRDVAPSVEVTRTDV